MGANFVLNLPPECRCCYLQPGGGKHYRQLKLEVGILVPFPLQIVFEIKFVLTY